MLLCTGGVLGVLKEIGSSPGPTMERIGGKRGKKVRKMLQ
jgi:hypothetical protein